MAKGKNTTIFFCQECGYESSKWLGQCPGCKKWNTFVEEKVTASSSGIGRSTKTNTILSTAKVTNPGLLNSDVTIFFSFTF